MQVMTNYNISLHSSVLGCTNIYCQRSYWRSVERYTSLSYMIRICSIRSIQLYNLYDNTCTLYMYMYMYCKFDNYTVYNIKQWVMLLGKY